MDDGGRTEMSTYGRHFLLCGHGDCAPPEEAARLLAIAREELGDRRRLRNPERVKLSVADCLGVCRNGPIGVVYPEGVWYDRVDEVRVRRIAREHLVGGRPVESAVFHRLYPDPAAIPYAPAVRGDAGSYRAAPGDAEEPLKGRIAPADAAARQRRREEVRATGRRKGLLIVNTGNGKGKTTAAFGVAFRARGRGMKVGIVQFLKPGTANFGEIRAARRMGIDIIGTGDGFTWKSKDLDHSAALAQHGWRLAQERIAAGGYDVLVLDEFTYPLHYGWLDTDECLAWLAAHKPPMLHLVITGRYAPQRLIEAADLVTEMRPVKHPFEEQGIRAQPGIEF
jgi:cob(I)alamin adenosyltransferase